MSKQALVIGTGRIALGVAGELLHDAGWTVTFAGRNATTVAHLNRDRAYHLQLVSRSSAGTRTIAGIDAVTIGSPEFFAAGVDADVIVTAVGAGNLASVGAALTGPLRHRRRPIDVIAFENMADPGAAMRPRLTPATGRVCFVARSVALAPSWPAPSPRSTRPTTACSW